MRHLLTWGCMTVAFNDIIVLLDLLHKVNDFGDWLDIYILYSVHHQLFRISALYCVQIAVHNDDLATRE